MKAVECAQEDMVADLTPLRDGITDLIIDSLPEHLEAHGQAILDMRITEDCTKSL